MNTEITIKCPECKRSMKTRREPEDPKNAVTMEDWCPECVNGGFSDPRYFDADGKEVDRLSNDQGHQSRESAATNKNQP